MPRSTGAPPSATPTPRAPSTSTSPGVGVGTRRGHGASQVDGRAPPGARRGR